MRRALLVVLVVLAPALAGCADPEGASRASLVAYPKLGDEATYRVDRLVDLARWENGHEGPFDVRFHLEESTPAFDAARLVHDVFRVRVASDAGRSFLFVSPRHEAVVQALYPLAGDQAIVAFDERGYPWLFGASALFGQEIRPGSRVTFQVPDNFGTGRALNLSWRAAGEEDVGGVRAVKLVLEGNASLEGALWMEPGNAWPLRAQLVVKDAAVEPMIRVDGPLPARMDARRVALTPGSASLPPRDRAASFTDDATVAREAWDGFAPPDGASTYAPYALGEAIADAKLLDSKLADWLKAAAEPRLYRATSKSFDGPAQGTLNATWLLVFVDRGEHYYATQMGKLVAPGAPSVDVLPRAGVPRVESSGPYDPPASTNHGWFAASAVPAKLVPLSEGVRVVQAFFGAKGVQVFLRSFADPPGYSYFLDGGWDGDKGEKGRYTVVYDPNTGLLQEATGHGVVAKLAEASKP